MTVSRPNLALEIIWFDNDLLELRLTVVSAGFAGRANFYAALDELNAFAKHIEGFPVSASDSRHYEFGSTSLPGYGGAKIELSCKDASGHLALKVSVHTNPDDPMGSGESATVQLHAVPADIDRFVAGLYRLPLEVGETVALQVAA